MHSFKDLSVTFNKKFESISIPSSPATLYDACKYFLALGGKRVRPVLCLMGNELFDEISDDTWNLAFAVEIFHNFTLIHDDIMDKAPLRRSNATVHEKFGEPTALLSGDVLLVLAYEFLNEIRTSHLKRVVALFNKTARQVCEGQQLDMDFEKQEVISLDEYLKMIELKTSVLLAASLKMGAILGGASKGNRHHIYEFGRNLGIAFQIQDDYLDAFGDPEKFGKDVGGDIRQNKKTFLLVRAMELADSKQKDALQYWMQSKDENAKLQHILQIFNELEIPRWAIQLKQQYVENAFRHLEDIAVVRSRKQCLKELAEFLIDREN